MTESNGTPTQPVALIGELTTALRDLGDWLAYGLEKPDGAEPTDEEVRRCEEVGERAGAAVAKGENFLATAEGAEVDWTSGFPFEADDEYERQFYCGTVLDGVYARDLSEKFTALSPALRRAAERSTDADVWGVYQAGKDWDDDGYREDRLVALVFKQNVYLFEPEPKECKAAA